MFIDSHCEVNDGWLEPLVARIMADPTVVAQPVIDIIDGDTFEVVPAVPQVVRMSWALEFYWVPLPSRGVGHVNTPIMAGKHTVTLHRRDRHFHVLSLDALRVLRILSPARH